MHIPEMFYEAVGEAKSLRDLIDEVWVRQGLPPRSTLGSRGGEYEWALRCLLGRLGSPGLPTVGPWGVSARVAGEVQGEARLVAISSTPGVSKTIGSVARSMWWPKVPLTRGVPSENGLVWRWDAAGRWGFAGTLEEGRSIVDEVLSVSGWPMDVGWDLRYDYCECGGVFELGHRGGCTKPWVLKAGT